MHVTIVGAGALGRVYGVRLAAAGERVSFVVRAPRLGETSPFVIEQVNGPRRKDAIERPDRVAEIPRETAVVVVAVRFEQLDADGALVDRLRHAPAVPIVVLTPMLPGQRHAIERALLRPLTPAMPGISGYLDERGVVRYWLAGVASTLLEEAAGASASTNRAAVEEVARRLTGAGIPSHLEHDVGALDAATTTAFFPLIAAIDVGSGIDGVLADKQLLATVLEAARESEALGQKLGKIAPWAQLLTRFVGPYTLAPGIKLARRLVPEAVHFVETHFGPKLHEQHLAMGSAILDLGQQLGQPMPALTRMMELLRR